MDLSATVWMLKVLPVLPKTGRSVAEHRLTSNETVTVVRRDIWRKKLQTRRPASAEGQPAANFRLMANQWAERRLVTQWSHGCRAMRRSVCNTGASNAGPIPLRSDIKGTDLPPANILIPLERQLIALQLCRWQFLYNETLHQPFRRLLSKLFKRRQS